jgi:hypothetical protein
MMEVPMYETASSDAFGAMYWVVMFAMYFYFTFAQFKIAQKIRHSDPWWAFIPILNMFQWVQLAHKEWYWFLFLFIPVVNIICMAILWMDIAKACNKSPFWGILTLFPFLNFVSIGVMAFSGNAQYSSPTPHDHSKPRQPEHVA